MYNTEFLNDLPVIPSSVIIEIVKDAISQEGNRLTTFRLRVPRCIWPEFLTHRVFSRNGRSSRAVPVKTMLEEIKKDPFIPWHWGKNQPGMQADEEQNTLIRIEEYGTNASDPESFIGYEIWSKNYFRVSNREAWLYARDNAVSSATGFADAGYHKQLVNRLVEPFMWIDVLITATEWDNFFKLRTHKDAEPHFRDIAQHMYARYITNEPEVFTHEMLYLPYVTDEELKLYDQLTCIKLSVARCARISYKSFDGNDSIEKELDRFEKLVGSEPKHYSPFEHQAQPDETYFIGESDIEEEWRLQHLALHGNFVGWIQMRKIDEIKMLTALYS